MMTMKRIGAALLLTLTAVSAFAQGTVAPVARQQFLDNNGNPLANGRLYVYAAGTTTPVTIYTDAALTTPALNAAVCACSNLDGSGRFTYFLASSSYRFTLKTSADVLVWDVDGVASVPSAAINLDVTGNGGEALSAGQVVYLSDGSGSKVAGSWYKADSANVYSSTQPELGVAVTAIASGGSGTIRLAGRVSGLSLLTLGSPYYVGTAGALTSTAPANRRQVGVADSTTTLVTLPTPAAAQLVPGTSTITTTGTQTALPIPGGTGPLVLYANNATLLTIQGITAGIDGQRLTIYSIGAGQIDTVHQSGSAGAALRLLNIATSGNTSAAAGSGTFDYVYDATIARWRLVSHEQGAWITPTFAGGNFTGSGTIAWTVAGGNVVMFKYWLKGRALVVAFNLTTTTVAGAGTILQISNAAWGGYSASSTGFANLLAIANDSPTAVGARVSVTGGATLGLQKTNGANWTAGATTDVTGEITIEVT